MELKQFIKESMPKGKSLTAMAKELKVPQSTSSNWLMRGRIPTKYLFAVSDYIEVDAKVLRRLMNFEKETI